MWICFIRVMMVSHSKYLNDLLHWFLVDIKQHRRQDWTLEGPSLSSFIPSDWLERHVTVPSFKECYLTGPREAAFSAVVQALWNTISLKLKIDIYPTNI